LQQALFSQLPLQQSVPNVHAVFRSLQQAWPAPHVLPPQQSEGPEHALPALSQQKPETQDPLQQSAPVAHGAAEMLQQVVPESPKHAWFDPQLSGQSTSTPQLLTAVPLHCPSHAAPLSKQQLLAPASPPPQTPPSQVLEHSTEASQLLLVVPQALPAQATPGGSGAQHCPLSGKQISPPLQVVCGHGKESPQETMDVLQTLVPQALASISQQTPPSSHIALPEQVPLPLPQPTSSPQLSVTYPHCRLPHVLEIGSGTQPHVWFAPHVSPPSHPPQSIVSPQLSVVVPHRPWHQTDGATGMQQLPPWHTPPSSQAHGTVCPQLFVTLTPH
jgi:hypothetical protein